MFWLAAAFYILLLRRKSSKLGDTNSSVTPGERGDRFSALVARDQIAGWHVLNRHAR
jgi:hypothetical protein